MAIGARTTRFVWRFVPLISYGTGLSMCILFDELPKYLTMVVGVVLYVPISIFHDRQIEKATRHSCNFAKSPLLIICANRSIDMCQKQQRPIRHAFAIIKPSQTTLPYRWTEILPETIQNLITTLKLSTASSAQQHK